MVIRGQALSSFDFLQMHRQARKRPLWMRACGALLSKEGERRSQRSDEAKHASPEANAASLPASGRTPSAASGSTH